MKIFRKISIISIISNTKMFNKISKMIIFRANKIYRINKVNQFSNNKNNYNNNKINNYNNKININKNN